MPWNSAHPGIGDFCSLVKFKKLLLADLSSLRRGLMY